MTNKDLTWPKDSAFFVPVRKTEKQGRQQERRTVLAGQKEEESEDDGQSEAKIADPASQGAREGTNESTIRIFVLERGRPRPRGREGRRGRKREEKARREEKKKKWHEPRASFSRAGGRADRGRVSSLARPRSASGGGGGDGGVIQRKPAFSRLAETSGRTREPEGRKRNSKSGGETHSGAPRGAMGAASLGFGRICGRLSHCG